MKKYRFIALLIFTIITTIISIINFIGIYNKKIKPYNIKKKEYINIVRKNKKIKEEFSNEVSKEINYLVLEKNLNNKKNDLEKIISEKQISMNKKNIYLTFDDGPSIYTEEILKILDKYNAKATFFVTCKSNLEEMSKKIIDNGHTLALHTCTHNYRQIYSSIDDYFNDLNEISNRVENATGKRSMYIRFPGGSSNTISRFNKGIMTDLSNEVNNRGYKYYDWNIDSNDAGGANSDQIISNVVKSLDTGRNTYMVLMHDTKESTKNALEQVLIEGTKKGYIFSNINNYTSQVHHGINN